MHWGGDLELSTSAPHDKEAEEAVLAALMITDNEEDIAAIFGLLKPEDFFLEQHRWVFEAARDRWAANDAINLLTVANTLSHTQQGARGGESRLESIGGREFLADIIRLLPSPIGVMFYANIVWQESQKRQLIHKAHGIIEIARKGNRPFSEIKGAALDSLFSLGGGEEDESKGGPIGDLMMQGLLGYLVERFENPAGQQGISTGIPNLDRRINGLEPATTYSISAPSSLGKSFLTMYWAWKAAEAGYKVVYFSTEMSKEMIGFRFTCMIAGLDGMVERRRHPRGFTDEEIYDLNQAAGHLASLPISLYPRYSPPMSYIKGVLRRERARGDIGLIILDGLHSMEFTNVHRRDIELGQMASELNQFSQEFNCPVAYVVHQNRNEAGGDMLNKIRDSANIGDRAAVSIFLKPMSSDWEKELSADEARARSDVPGWCNVHLSLAKVRNGTTGVVPVRLSWRSGGRWAAVES